jgi:ferredoxin
MLKIAISKFEDLFAAISRHMGLYLPIEETGLVEFRPWLPGSAVRLERLHTTRSPKDFFFPSSENIAAFTRHKNNITIEASRPPATPFALFGVRACDAASFDILDRVFMGDPQFVDSFYATRRQNGVVITAACLSPEESCFCTAFGSSVVSKQENPEPTCTSPVIADSIRNPIPCNGPHLPDSSTIKGEIADQVRNDGVEPFRHNSIDALNPAGDVATALVGDTLYWQALTEKGQALTEKLRPLFESADTAALEAAKTAAKAIFEKLPFAGLSLAGFESADLMEMFNSPQWGSLHYACLGCGTCTFTCPTCHCYDIGDYNTGEKIVRSRCWDSCMYSDFTLMAHGNPRTSQLQRFRQRFMHKLVYFPENNGGVFACTGCGRCVQKCPVSLNIVKVAKALEDMPQGGQNA